MYQSFYIKMSDHIELFILYWDGCSIVEYIERTVFPLIKYSSAKVQASEFIGWLFLTDPKSLGIIPQFISYQGSRVSWIS